MTEADRIFERFPDFIREYIYRHSWESLREIQVLAARAILEGNDNLLISSATAGGKTEAVFFPILADLCNNPPEGEGVSVLYIAPLKSLINDQFYRMEELLEESRIPVFHWHGEVSSSKKTAFLKKPSGILQITPESLESMLMNRSNDIGRLFGDLRYVVLDEIHTMVGSDRGAQILCQLSRISRLCGKRPRRIGLSATLGDPAVTASWLSAGSGRKTVFPKTAPLPLRWRLGMQHFFIEDTREDQSRPVGQETGASLAPPRRAKLDPGYEFLYDTVKGSQALVFSNSREETEYVTATLRQIARLRGEPDVFLIHHGNLSASLREEAEARLKEGVDRTVVCATVTMELGIDIGRLKGVAQMGAPTTVSGLLQRLGRSGRRGSPPEMVMIYREETPLPNATLPEIIPWELLRGIALVELYAKERFIEPPTVRTMPMSLLFQQTLSHLSSFGEMLPRELAAAILKLPPFLSISKEDYRELLLSMVKQDYLELTEEGGLIVGLRGERLTGSFRFYAVFEDSEDYTVRSGSAEIGTITTPPPIGDRFALAGRAWEVEELDTEHRLVFVKPVEGKLEISWPGNSGEIHTRILEKMREILTGEEEYPYLLPNAAARLAAARSAVRHMGLERSMVISLGGNSFVLFPWLGTRAFRTARRYLAHLAGELGISDIRGEGCCYITFKAAREDGEQLQARLSHYLSKEPFDASSLVGEEEAPQFEKYDPFIPAPLLRRAFIRDRLNPAEMIRRFQ